MCGEKLIPPLLGFGFTGSPPHVRGKVQNEAQQNLWSRITPACAGKREMPPTGAARTRDHPRTCGEKPDSFRRTIYEKGSPPHMRGKERLIHG